MARTRRDRPPDLDRREEGRGRRRLRAPSRRRPRRSTKGHKPPLRMHGAQDRARFVDCRGGRSHVLRRGGGAGHHAGRRAVAGAFTPPFTRALTCLSISVSGSAFSWSDTQERPTHRAPGHSERRSWGLVDRASGSKAALQRRHRHSVVSLPRDTHGHRCSDGRHLTTRIGRGRDPALCRTRRRVRREPRVANRAPRLPRPRLGLGGDARPRLPRWSHPLAALARDALAR